MNLHIDVAGDTALIPIAEHAWAAFETSFVLPFAYDKPAIFGVCDDTAVSALAESMLHEGVATIRVTRDFLDAPLIERHLTLLHESLHVASLSGTLRNMYAATTRFEETHVRQTLDRIRNTFKPEDQWPIAERFNSYHPIASALAQHLYEVDVELALGMQYPGHVAARNEYYVKLRNEGFTSHPYTNVAEGCRVYWILLDRLRAELAGVLAGDDSVTRELWSRIEQVPGFVEPSDENEIATLHQMLSPKWKNFADLSQWGAATYEAVVRLVTEKAFNLESL
jgi:hypothetical protein